MILEAFSLDNNDNYRYGETPDRDWKKESNIDGMRFGLTKLEAVMEQYERRNWSYALLPIARCHGNWADITTIGSNLNFYLGGGYKGLFTLSSQSVFYVGGDGSALCRGRV